MTEVVTAGLLRSYEVLKRQQTHYDYEKVFWSSTYGLGLVGLGWIAIKLGKIIQGGQEVITDLSEAITNPKYETYKLLYDWVEGEHKDDTPTYHLQTLINQYRNDPEAWKVYKEDILEQHPEWNLTPTGEPAKNPTSEILNSVDNLYVKYGPIMPLGVLAGNISLEYLRVRKVKEELK